MNPKKTLINVVWFKRDLRLSDHEPLKLAYESGKPVLLLYVFEPMTIADKHYDHRHWRFVTESIHDINHQLSLVGIDQNVSVAHNDILSVFSDIMQHYQIGTIFSYQETGLANTFIRDLALKAWCEDKAIAWHESATGAVIRGAKNRFNWDKHWNEVMRAPLNEVDVNKLKLVSLKFETSALPRMWLKPNSQFQLGGESEARRVLTDFFDERGQDYHRAISKPQQSLVTCSRLSPYLAWGNISLREVYQTLLSHWNRRGWRRALIALSSRLHWHCHFIQKFESECSMEFEPVNKGYLRFPYRDFEVCKPDLLAWKSGQTGYPLVDACMRCLNQTGYINFRMRAMLVSFLTHNLRIDWRFGVTHLAQMFLDFEPGIHYSQFQMQASVTGVNTIRIYNPTKQALDHDPGGDFIRRWCSELENLPTPLLFEPWLLTPMEETMYGVNLGVSYPMPIVDIKQQYKTISDRLWSWRKRAEVRKEASRILAKHVRLD